MIGEDLDVHKEPNVSGTEPCKGLFDGRYDSAQGLCTSFKRQAIFSQGPLTTWTSSVLSCAHNFAGGQGNDNNNKNKRQFYRQSEPLRDFEQPERFRSQICDVDLKREALD